jgi:hypothetical protein
MLGNARGEVVTAVEQSGPLHLDMQLIRQCVGASAAPARGLLLGRRCEGRL